MVSSQLAVLLDDRAGTGETLRPPRLIEAMRHGVLNGGKRLRPFLLIEVARLFDCEVPFVLRAACALECLHCYSLIHDDLPAMDNDNLRRGQPTVHIAYDEAMAILAGDGLATLAFDLLSEPVGDVDPLVQLKLVSMLARSAGQGGMIGGQVLDMEAETKTLDEREIMQLQAMKTGALLCFACEAGAVIAGAGDQPRQHIRRFGEFIGQAFQLADDLLDVSSDSAMVGKTTGKDAKSGKKTLVDLCGIDVVRQKLDQLCNDAISSLAPFDHKADVLRQTAQFVANRSL